MTRKGRFLTAAHNSATVSTLPHLCHYATANHAEWIIPTFWLLLRRQPLLQGRLSKYRVYLYRGTHDAMLTSISSTKLVVHYDHFDRLSLTTNRYTALRRALRPGLPVVCSLGGLRVRRRHILSSPDLIGVTNSSRQPASTGPTFISTSRFCKCCPSNLQEHW